MGPQSGRTSLLAVPPNIGVEILANTIYHSQNFQSRCVQKRSWLQGCEVILPERPGLQRMVGRFGKDEDQGFAMIVFIQTPIIRSTKPLGVKLLGNCEYGELLLLYPYSIGLTSTQIGRSVSFKTNEHYRCVLRVSDVHETQYMSTSFYFIDECSTPSHAKQWTKPTRN